jgi:hypothetical protein
MINVGLDNREASWEAVEPFVIPELPTASDHYLVRLGLLATSEQRYTPELVDAFQAEL